MISLKIPENSPSPHIPVVDSASIENFRRRLKVDELQEDLQTLELYFEELDEIEKVAIFQDWRYRLIFQSAELECSKERKEWFLHMLTQEHDLSGLLTLIHEFNHKQLEKKSFSNFEEDSAPFDLIEMRFEPKGLFMGIKRFKD